MNSCDEAEIEMPGKDVLMCAWFAVRRIHFFLIRETDRQSASRGVQHEAVSRAECAK